MAQSRAKKPKAPLSLDEMLETAALPERTVPVCLRGDLVAEIEDLEREMLELRQNAQTMADHGQARALAEKIEAARETMHAYTRVFRVRGLGGKGWPDLVAAHKPRDGEDGDQALGYNVETFFPDLLRKCLIDPVITDDGQFARLVEKMSSRQYDDLVEAAIAVNRRKVDVPFSFAASAALRTFDEKSEQPAP